MRAPTALLLTIATLTACKRATVEPTPSPTPPQPVVAAPDDSRMYTTYFYTAAEAVVHGYEAKTRVRIVSLEDPATERKPGTIW
ncbi:MAG: hypothetical protein H0T79_02505, partial [Deltaproteobacteria bacterium]|nr:hypothetical protein [Deltaproteobacteria bacterium]